MNDRALRDITVSLGGPGNGYPRQDGFDIVVASEVMAIFCLSTSLDDLKARLGRIVVAYTRDQKPVLASDLQAHGAMTVLLKDAIKPNLVQTLENNPAFIHGGPFANIAHGCNSVIATSSAMKLVDYVVTEAGFGADLGAEKFIDIKCRKSGLRPSAAVIVGTVRALKYHGGADLKTVNQENMAALGRGIVNLERHVENVSKHYGTPSVVSINRFTYDTPREHDFIKARMAKLGVPVVIATHWGDGSRGAAELAHIVVELCETKNSFRFVYGENDSLWEKINAIAQRIYRASEVTADAKVRNQIKKLQVGLRRLSGLRRQDPVLVFDRPAIARRPRQPRDQRARSAAGGGGRVRRDDLRGYHDDAGASQGAFRGQDRPRRREGRRTILNAG